MRGEKVKINFIEEQGEILTITFPKNNASYNSSNNISGFRGSGYDNSYGVIANPEAYGEPLKTPSRGEKRFILMGKNGLGGSRLGDGSVWGKKEYDGYLSCVNYTGGKFVNQRTGVISDTFDMDINGNGIKFLMIYFDRMMNHYPSSILFNDIKYNNETAIAIRAWEAPQTSIKVQFEDYNSEMPIRFTGVIIGFSKTYSERSGLTSLRRGSQSTADNKKPEFTALGQQGSFEIKDKDGIIGELDSLHLLTPDIKCQLLKDDIVIGSYLFDGDSNYDSSEKRFKASLRDRLDDWHFISIPLQSLKEQKTALDLFNHLKNYDTTINYIISSEMQSYLQNIQIAYDFEESTTLRESMSLFQDLTGTRGNLDENGQFVVSL